MIVEIKFELPRQQQEHFDCINGAKYAAIINEVKKAISMRTDGDEDARVVVESVRSILKSYEC